MSLDELTLESMARRSGLKWAKPDPGVIPAWVADMDFPTAPAITAAVAAQADDLTYPEWLLEPGAGPLAEVFAERMARRFGWHPDPGHVRSYSDLNQALQVLLHVATKPGDGVAVHVPTYPPFLETLQAMDRPRLDLPMVPDADTWGCDLEPLRSASAAPRCRVLLLVNPHNPTGRAFTRGELESMAELAERHDLIVIADEIHADLTYPPAEHIPVATLLPERTITISSATKAFNMGGLRCSVAHIGVPSVRDALAAQPEHLYGSPGTLGVAATVAAWRHGDPWLEEIMAVLDRNRRLLAKRLPAHVGYRLPDATYLAWLDFRDAGLPDEEPAEFLYREARVMLSAGSMFGPGGTGFARLNFATSAPIMEELASRISRALGSN